MSGTIYIEDGLVTTRAQRYPSQNVQYHESIICRKLEGEEKGKIHNPDRWVSFIASNLLAYTVIFHQLLPRFMRIDLVAPKNALMLFRVTKVCLHF